MILEKGSKLLFIGDSITDCDRTKPVGEGFSDDLGKGYVAFVEGLLRSVYPERQIRVVNMGTSGHTVRDLQARWPTDVISQKPDWVSIMIGINDVWRQFDSPFHKEKHVYIDEYEKTLRQLVTETKPFVTGIILMTPFFIESNKNDPMRRTMDQYGNVVIRLAKETNCLIIDTQAAFDQVLKTLHSASLAWDRVHPDTAGHMVIARAFLDQIGFDWKKSF